MKPHSIPLAQVRQLPLVYRASIPPEYEDENGHMNVRWYMALFDDAGYPLVDKLGLTPEYHREHGTGGFDLEHHIHYLREVYIGDTVAIYVRLVGRTAKRMHYLLFMIDETHEHLAAIFECVNSFADLRARRTAPYPPEIAERLDALLRQHSALDWEAPVCGVISA